MGPALPSAVHVSGSRVRRCCGRPAQLVWDSSSFSSHDAYDDDDAHDAYDDDGTVMMLMMMMGWS